MPPRLPRGPHGLSRDEVLTIQRERLMIAYTELVAAHGFHATGIGDVVKRSGMSRTAFYDCFDGLDACADAACQRFIQVLVTEMTAHLADVGNDLPAVIGAYLGALQRDLVVARCFQLEFDAAGPVARERRRTALTLIARLLLDEHRRMAADDPALDPDLDLEVFLGAVYAVRQLASDRLDTEPAPDLPSLEPQLSGWLTRSLRR
ncbi:MAG: TetR/AcrR family transcriptional regulator [Gordonia sp. (in: high G+C Gram-positive bacteria)]|uniref:TetR/AcrR family transcriptional regulator n=1 Tax=Gordonia sp. (in: high G+C Gram-positive bacteria) TaxID=84139 RepID=UPI0039E285D7